MTISIDMELAEKLRNYHGSMSNTIELALKEYFARNITPSAKEIQEKQKQLQDQQNFIEAQDLIKYVEHGRFPESLKKYIYPSFNKKGFSDEQIQQIIMLAEELSAKQSQQLEVQPESE